MKHKNTKPRGAAQAKCTKRLGNITITLLAMLLAFSCSKYEDLPTVEVEKDPITLAKEQFQRDSIAFARSGAKPNYNFRQSLTRRINWSESISTDSLLYVPLRMVLPDGTVTSDGSNELPNKAWLVIGKDEDDNSFHYRMVTLFPDSLDVKGEFSGIALFEDYFLGDVSYGEYTQGSLLSRQSSLRRRHRSGDGLKANMPLDCEWIAVATICVGYMPGGSSEPICSDRYEYQCSYSGGGDDGGGSLPPGSGNTGGSSGGGNNNNIVFTVVAPAITINLQQRLHCFNSVPNSGATYKITLHAHKGVGGGNKPGHAFITLEKSNGSNIQRLSYGFYPVSSLSSATMQSVPSAIGEESGDQYRKSDSRYSLTITAAQFQSVINSSLSLANQQYHLLYNNCVHYATDVFNRVNPPTGQMGNNGFISPDDLDTYLRIIKSLNPNQQGIETNRMDLLPSSNCN